MSKYSCWPLSPSAREVERLADEVSAAGPEGLADLQLAALGHVGEVHLRLVVGAGGDRHLDGGGAVDQVDGQQPVPRERGDVDQVGACLRRARSTVLTPAATWIGSEHWPASTVREWSTPAASVTVKLNGPDDIRIRVEDVLADLDPAGARRRCRLVVVVDDRRAGADQHGGVTGGGVEVDAGSHRGRCRSTGLRCRPGSARGR